MVKNSFKKEKQEKLPSQVTSIAEREYETSSCQKTQPCLKAGTAQTGRGLSPRTPAQRSQEFSFPSAQAGRPSCLYLTSDSLGQRRWQITHIISRGSTLSSRLYTRYHPAKRRLWRWKHPCTGCHQPACHHTTPLLQRSGVGSPD